jgi:hypothetical protein
VYRRWEEYGIRPVAEESTVGGAGVRCQGQNGDGGGDVRQEGEEFGGGARV